jgi:hypothetical protein
MLIKFQQLLGEVIRLSVAYKNSSSFQYQNYISKYFYMKYFVNEQFSLELPYYNMEYSRNEYKNNLSSEYISDLNRYAEGDLSYDSLSEKYGTHLIAKGVYGGKAEIYYSVVSNYTVVNTTHEQQLNSAIGVALADIARIDVSGSNAIKSLEGFTENYANKNYISLNKEKIFTNEEGETRYKYRMSDDDLNFLKEKFPGYKFYPVIKQYENSIYFELYNYKMSPYDTNIYGIMELTEEIIYNTKLHLISGKIPGKLEDGTEEVVVSDYFYQLFEMYGYKDGDSKIDITGYDDLIGKSLNLNGKKCVISGIIDTGFDETRYISPTDGNFLYNEYEALCKYGLNNILFVREGYYDDIINKPEYEGTYLLKDGKQEKVTLYYEKEAIANGIYPVRSHYESISVHIGEPNQIFWKNGIKRTSLSDNEVIIPIGQMYYSKIGTIGSLKDNHEKRIRELAEKFADEHFSEIKDQWETSKESYVFYLINTDFNKYHQGYDKFYFESLAYEELFNEIYFPLFNKLRVS